MGIYNKKECCLLYNRYQTAGSGAQGEGEKPMFLSWVTDELMTLLTNCWGHRVGEPGLEEMVSFRPHPIDYLESIARGS